jgi:hypothetical protein
LPHSPLQPREVLVVVGVFATAQVLLEHGAWEVKVRVDSVIVRVVPGAWGVQVTDGETLPRIVFGVFGCDSQQ